MFKLVTIFSPFFFVIFTVRQIDATTEWFGDERSQFNPPEFAPFYDVVYDDNECPQGLRSSVIPGYVYFGRMISSVSVSERTDCVWKCLKNSLCMAANYFEPSKPNEKAYCELLEENQYDNPKLMRPFRNAAYYEKMKCELDGEVANDKSKKSKEQKDSNETENGSGTVFKGLEKKRLFSLEDPLVFMKTLANKVREFNLRFFRHRVA